MEKDTGGAGERMEVRRSYVRRKVRAIAFRFLPEVILELTGCEPIGWEDYVDHIFLNCLFIRILNLQDGFAGSAILKLLKMPEYTSGK